ncbi:MAG TPA: restriction endonuclease subunit S [Gemmata sp.]
MTEVTGLPSGWAWCTVADLAEVGTGTTPSRDIEDYWKGGSVPWVTSSAVNQLSVEEASENVTNAALQNTNLRLYPKHTLLLALYGEGKTRGKVSELLIEATINQALAAIQLNGPAAECRPYLKTFLQSHYEELRRQSLGGMQPNLNLGIVKRIRVPIAPLAEQHRIVEKVDELLSDVDAGVAALVRARANLKKYRAAVLKAAVTGELTADWRAAHPNAEPASALLDRILTDRRRKWEADQEAKFTASNKTPPKGWREKYPEPVSPDMDGLPQLPACWCWGTMDMLAELAGGITKGQKRKPEDRIREVPYLRVANVQRGYLDLSEMKTIEATEEDIAELQLQRGDILFNEGGDRDKLGRGWIWRGEIEQCIHQNHVFRARLFSNSIGSEFVSHHGNTFGQEWFSRAGKQSVNLASINMSVLRRFPVPVPPEEEQKVIITEVQQRLSVIDATENYIDASLKRASRLRQSILKEAFAGRLVPQDPADEPASVLLDRIRQSRSTDAGSAKATKLKRKRARGQQEGSSFGNEGAADGAG